MQWLASCMVRRQAERKQQERLCTTVMSFGSPVMWCIRKQQKSCRTITTRGEKKEQLGSPVTWCTREQKEWTRSSSASGHVLQHQHKNQLEAIDLWEGRPAWARCRHCKPAGSQSFGIASRQSVYGLALQPGSQSKQAVAYKPSPAVQHKRHGQHYRSFNHIITRESGPPVVQHQRHGQQQVENVALAVPPMPAFRLTQSRG